MEIDFLKEAEKFSFKNCKMLYKEVSKPSSESCAMWGWQFDDGWNQTVKDLSVKLEMLNLLFYPKYGVHIVMEEAKEKFGTLRFYYSVRTDSPLIYRIWHKPFTFVYEWLRRNINYNIVCLVDKESYYTDDKTEIDEKDVENKKKTLENVSNVEVKQIDGKWYEVAHMYHHAITHTEPTKHKILYYIQKMMLKMSIFLNFRKEPSSKQLVIADAVDRLANQFVAEAEKECYNTCECCGARIGLDYSPRVQTKGWIKYLCETCDAKERMHFAKRHIDSFLDVDGNTISADQATQLKDIEKLFSNDEYKSVDVYKESAEKLEKIADSIKKLQK